VSGTLTLAMTAPLAWAIAGRSIATPGRPSVDQKSG
jgi:hypothetical protein